MALILAVQMLWSQPPRHYLVGWLAWSENAQRWLVLNLWRAAKPLWRPVKQTRLTRWLTDSGPSPA